ncbi:ATP-dependent DNA helicase RecG [Crocinitomicaceae bacterium CZZ-1]|uniref:ATP-dependent DNA helicase RecG n=1 Tax=Taishania pollutisoli TaxID=2766479 RepID=A0A8J6PHB5_9FLAO|nr:ATP-dependent DNA helicase RecG [Taishania pollutisoli]MBC9810875.1 ATP-dependent DNA helicase RecG [Taishania pollutisoli]
MNFLQTSIEFLKGVGPQRAELLKSELDIHTYEDLLNHFPFRYIDRSQYHTVAELPQVDTAVQLRGYIIEVKESGVGKRRKLTAKFEDHTGMIELIWFQGIKWILPALKKGVELQVYGKPKLFGKSWNIPHPEVTEFSKVKQEVGLQPVYSTTEKLTDKGLHSKGIEKLLNSLIEQLPILPETLPAQLLNHLRLMDRRTALIQIHQPAGEEQAIKARGRLKFEELFYLQMELLVRKQLSVQKTKGFIFPDVGNLFTDFYNRGLPFDLTGAQKRVLKEIRKDFLNGHHMNRLLQGDVGAGKTLVALLTALMGIGNGFQAALIAPTEILATQHFETIRELLKDFPVKTALLTGSSKTKERRILHEELLSGEIHLLIGTHALLENTVQFQNLGIVIIDEQHRFGVAQRAKMRRKNTTPPHVLIMTATPIPRTLAMTFYGDLDVSVIDELPPGRKPITTVHRMENSRLQVFGFLKEEINKGRQVYIVYPLINESETLDFNNLMDGYEAISRAFPLPAYRVSMVHGKLKPEEKEFEMQRFVKGETQIMVATTVIEVGVNVPNASVMIIESAERFGLSQLHQLRGRVGRGAEQSYCILMTGNKLSKETKKRLETMVRTNDGFEIAEVDLQLRGPGDLLGTQQSGALNLKIADLAKDAQIVVRAREEARSILEKDPNLELPEHAVVRTILTTILKKKPNWGKIA